MLDSPETTRVFRDAHGWFGVVFSVLAFVIFFAGTVSFYRPAIESWQEASQREVAQPTEEQVLRWIDEEWQLRAEQGAGWVGWSLPTDRHPVATGAVYSSVLDTPFVRADVSRGVVEPRQSKLGSFLYELHYFAMVPEGYLISGITGLVLLLLAITGILVQGTRFVRDLWQYRPGLAHANRWLDLHKVVGGMALPYIVLFAWTGSMMCLVAAEMRPMTVEAAFDGERAAYSEGRGYRWAEPPTGQKVAPPSVTDVKVAAEDYFGGAIELTWFEANNAGDENGIYGIVGEMADSGAEVGFRVTPDVELFDASGLHGATNYESFLRPLYDLHVGRWASDLLRLCLVFLGLGCAGAVWVGNRLWIERRIRERKRGRATLLWRLTVGGCAGLVFAIGVQFAASKLLPLNLADRTGMEEQVFWVAWGGAFAVSMLVRQTHQLLVAIWSAAALSLVVALAADVSLSGVGHLETPTWRDVQWVRLLLLASSAACAVLALRTARELRGS